MNETSNLRASAQALLEDCRYEQAAMETFALAQTTKEASLYIDSCLYFLLGNKNDLAMEVAAQLSSTPIAADVKFLRILSYILLFSNTPTEASNVLELLSKTGQNNTWATTLKTQIHLNPSKVMAINEEFKAVITESAVVSAMHIVYFCMKLQCKECSYIYPARYEKSIFQLKFAPCIKCARPHIVTPTLLADNLRNSTEKYDREELHAIDCHIWTWIHNWNRNVEPVEAAKHKYAKDLLDLCWCRMRYSFSEHYLRLFNKIKRKTELL